MVKPSTVFLYLWSTFIAQTSCIEFLLTHTDFGTTYCLHLLDTHKLWYKMNPVIVTRCNNSAVRLYTCRTATHRYVLSNAGLDIAYPHSSSSSSPETPSSPAHKVPRVHHYSFLPNSFQFFVHHLPIQALYPVLLTFIIYESSQHSTLRSPNCW